MPGLSFTQQRNNFQFCATCFGFSPSPPPCGTCPQYRSAAVLRFASESTHARAHTHAWLCAPGARAPSRTVSTRHCIAHPSFFVSLQQLRQRRGRPRETHELWRVSGGRHSWTRRRDDSDEHANRTGAHRSHLCSHVTIGGTARPGMHLAHFVLRGGSFASCAACALRRAEDLLRAADQRARDRHVRGLLLSFSQLPFMALPPPRTFL